MMANEYVVYWRREVFCRTKVIADSTEDALITAANNLLQDGGPWRDDDFDELGPVKIDNIELIEKDVL
jgi:hypothetical protein